MRRLWEIRPSAVSAGILELAAARDMRLRRHVADAWFLGLAGVTSAAFSLAFFALGFSWIRLEHPDALFFDSGGSFGE